MVAASKRRTTTTSAAEKASRRRRPALLLLGDRGITSAVGQSLDSLKVTPWWAPWTDDATELIDEETIAVVVVGPLPDAPVADAIARIQRSATGASVAQFAVLTHPLSATEIRRIYGAGATAVFDWPAERRALPQLLVELLAVDLASGPVGGADAALARTIRAHLQLARGFGPPLRVRVRDGVAVLSGRVDHLWQKQRVEELAVNIPGVRSVAVRDIDVAPSNRTDKAIRRNVRRFCGTPPTCRTPRWPSPCSGAT